MLDKLVLVERFDDQTLEITWKFPSGIENETLLLERIKWIWLEPAPVKVRAVRFRTSWQSLAFGAGFALVGESSSEPSNQDFSKLYELAMAYEKTKSIQALSKNFLVLPNDHSLRSNTDPAELLKVLLSFPDYTNAATVLLCTIEGRLRLCNGSSRELSEVGRILSSKTNANLIPFILGPTTEELQDLYELGSFICCCPNEESRSSEGIYWDVSVNWTTRSVSQRPSVSFNETKLLSICTTIENADDDNDLIRVCETLTQ